jgi:hypothetical protein
MRMVFLTVAAWMCGVATASAQGIPPKPSAAESGGSWVMAYMLVLLVITLGLIIVLKSSGRRERAKPETYGEAKTLPKE